MDDQDVRTPHAPHKPTAALSNDAFDKMLRSLIGLPNGAHTKPAVVQEIDFYGHSTSYMVQTVRTDEGITAFVTQVSAAGSVRSILPQRVLQALDRQRSSITKQLRRRHGRRIAEERSAEGLKPAFLK